MVEAHLFQSGMHSAGSRQSGFHTELFSKGNPDSRGFLDHHDLFRIVNGIPDLLHFTLLPQRSGGTHGGTLTAIDAGTVSQSFLEKGIDIDIKSTVREIDGIHGLHFVTHGNAAAAGNTFPGVPDNGRVGLIQRFFLVDGRVLVHVHVQVIGQVLEFAMSVGHTGGTDHFVVGKNHLHQVTPHRPQFPGLGTHFYIRSHRGTAGTLGYRGAFNLHYTDSAGRGGGKVLVIAQGGNVNVQLFSGIQNHGSRRNLYGFTVNI